MKTLILIVVFCYCGLLAVIYFHQRKLQYFPDTSRPDIENYDVEGMRVITTKTEDNLDIESWVGLEKDAPVIVHFHGNGSHLGTRSFKARAYMKAGYNFVLAGYRGYGGNKGTPTENGLFADARSLMQWLSKEGVKPENIILYGESLGTGVAVKMASEFSVGGIVLEAPYSSTVDVGMKKFPFLPIKLMMKDQFHSTRYIKKVHAPLLIIHGDQDEVIPIELSRKLYDTAHSPKMFVEIDGGSHNDLYARDALSRILHFLEDHSLPPR